MARATACSATTVLPAPVGAATRTLCPASIAAMASSWKRSSVKVIGPARQASFGRSGPVATARDDPTDDDRYLVEDAHGDGQCEQADRIRARRDHGGDHEDDHDPEAAELAQLLRLQDPDRLQEHQQDRELE